MMNIQKAQQTIFGEWVKNPQRKHHMNNMMLTKDHSIIDKNHCTEIESMDRKKNWNIPYNLRLDITYIEHAAQTSATNTFHNKFAAVKELGSLK